MFNDFRLVYKHNGRTGHQWIAVVRLSPSQLKNKSWVDVGNRHDTSIGFNDDYYPHAWADTADQVIINLYEQLIQKEVIDRL